MGNASSVTLSDNQVQEIMANTDCNIPTFPGNIPKDTEISLHLLSRPICRAPARQGGHTLPPAAKQTH
jgi:hypothetical protein